MGKVRVMHYVNQFFAGVGGEDKADVPLDFREGSLGPGNRLQALPKALLPRAFHSWFFRCLPDLERRLQLHEQLVLLIQPPEWRVVGTLE